MSHFAKVVNNRVIEIIVAEQEYINSLSDGDLYLQTSYNTFKGQNPLGPALRYNFAGIGYSYDAVRDAFIPPKPFPSWQLNESECWWYAPIPYPSDGGFYRWNEENQTWDPATP